MFNCLNKQKSLKNFLQGKNVSGNFVTKLPYYFQVWRENPQEKEILLTQELEGNKEGGRIEDDIHGEEDNCGTKQDPGS